MRDVLDEVILPLLAGGQTEEIAPDVVGLTSPNVRRMLNELVARLPTGEAYLEVGCWQGATLVSALLDNRHAPAYACDDWSETLCGVAPGEVKAAFERNLEKYKDRLPKVRFFDGDFQKMLPKGLEHPVGVFLYDGKHGAEITRTALKLAASFLAKRCVVIMDDFDAEIVQAGAWAGFADLRPKRMRFMELRRHDDDKARTFHNGIGVAYLELP